MHSIRRKTAVCALIIFTFSLLSGCAQNSGKNSIKTLAAPDETAQTELTFFGFKYEAANVMAIEDALIGFMDQYPDITISYDGIKGLTYFDTLNKRLLTGNGDDIFMVNHESAMELGAQGYLADLSGLSTLSQYSALAKSQMEAGGNIFYLPTSISAFGLFCNLDLLKKHGQKVPENLSEFFSVCDYFVAQGITPLIVNNDISLKTIVLAKGLLPFYQEDDAANAIIAFNRQEEKLAEALRPGFELVEQMLNNGYINRAEALVTDKTKDDLVLFAQGEQPFMLTGAWVVPRLRELLPTFDFAVQPYPILDTGSVLVINIDTRVSVLAQGPHLEEAKQFVEYLTVPDVLWEFVDSQCSFSPLIENRLSADQAVQPISAYLTNGYSVIGSDDNLQYPLWEISRQAVVHMLEGGAAAEAVDFVIEQLRGPFSGGADE